MQNSTNYQYQLAMLFLSLNLILAGQLNAQSVQIDEATRDGFDGLRKMSNDGYYIQFATEWTEGLKKGSAKVRIIMMDNELNITNDVWVTTRRGNIDDVAFNGENFMVMVSGQDRSRTFMIIDKEGKTVAEKVLEKQKGTFWNSTTRKRAGYILPVDESDFLVITFLKESRVGYSITRYNNELDILYSKEQIPEKKKLYPTDFFIEGDRLNVLEFITPDLSDYFEYHVASFDLNTGNEVYKQRLQQPGEKTSGYATFIKNGGDGKVMTGGMYFDGQRVQEANSDGFFAAVIEPDGNTKFSFTDWKNVKSDLKDEGTSGLLGGKTKTFMHDIAVNADGSFTLIGETYRKGDADMAGNKNKTLAVAGKLGGIGGKGSNDELDIAVTVSGFALMNFSKEGSFTSVDKIIERPTITIIKNTTDPEDLPTSGQRKGLNVANILNNNGYFPYRFVAENGDDKYIVSLASYKSLPMERLYFTKLNSTELDTASVNVTSSDLQLILDLKNKTLGKLGGLGKMMSKASEIASNEEKNDFELRNSHDPFDYRGKASSSRLLQSNIPGKVLIYDFVPIPEEGEKQKGFFGQLTASMKGSLKIWYIDLPNK